MMKLHAFVLILTAITGIALKAWHGPYADWINNSLSGVVYVFFWCVCGRLFFPRQSSFTIAISVFTASSCIEIVQLWHPPFLMLVRSTLPGAVLLGITFVWSDFIYYAIGAVLGWWYGKKVKGEV